MHIFIQATLFISKSRRPDKILWVISSLRYPICDAIHLIHVYGGLLRPSRLQLACTFISHLCKYIPESKYPLTESFLTLILRRLWQKLTFCMLRYLNNRLPLDFFFSPILPVLATFWMPKPRFFSIFQLQFSISITVELAFTNVWAQKCTYYKRMLMITYLERRPLNSVQSLKLQRCLKVLVGFDRMHVIVLTISVIIAGQLNVSNWLPMLLLFIGVECDFISKYTERNKFNNCFKWLWFFLWATYSKAVDHM